MTAVLDASVTMTRLLGDAKPSNRAYAAEPSDQPPMAYAFNPPSTAYSP